MTYGHQICQASKSREGDSNETKQTGAGDIITSKSLDKLYLHYGSAYGHQTWQWCDLLWDWVRPTHKVT